MVDTIHRLDLFDMGGTQDIVQIERSEWDPGIRSMLERGAGGTHPKFGAHQVQEPEFSFQTSQIDDLLSGINSISGAAHLLGTPITANSQTYMKKGIGLGNETRANLSHIRGTIAYCYVQVDRISLPHNDNGTADVTVVVGYDGTNEPIVYTGSVALSATSITSDKHFGAGPFYLNGTLVPSITNITIEPGIALETISSDTVVWPTFLGVRTSEPKITVTTLDCPQIVTAGVDGVALDGANGAVAYGRKFTKNQAGGVARVANATAEHLSFTAINGRYWVNPSGRDSDPIEAEIIVEATSTSDTVFPITYALAAIP